MRNPLLTILAVLVLLVVAVGPVAAQDEVIIEREVIEPGILLVFEGAPRDAITPEGAHLSEEATDVHLELRANWSRADSVDVPRPAARGGFVPYARPFAKVENQRTGQATFVSLVPHAKVNSGLHYARNVALPGDPAEDAYTVTYTVKPPPAGAVSFHSNWREQIGERLFERQTFRFENVRFNEALVADS
jgi:uncharacterized protein involved in high-affinity Fe2+ transport